MENEQIANSGHRRAPAREGQNVHSCTTIKVEDREKGTSDCRREVRQTELRIQNSEFRFPKPRNIHAGETKSAKMQWDPQKSVHWSAYDVKVAYFQEAHPSRNVIQKRVWQDRNPNSPDMEGFGAHWTQYQ